MLALVLLGCAALDLDMPGSRCSLLRRQTPRRLFNNRHFLRGAFLWGVDTGSVFSTYRASAASWAAVAMVAAGWIPLWAGALYAIGFCLPLTLAIVSFFPERASPAFLAPAFRADAVAVSVRLGSALPALRLTSAVLTTVAAASVCFEVIR